MSLTVKTNQATRPRGRAARIVMVVLLAALTGALCRLGCTPGPGSAEWPGPDNTGVPDALQLSDYDGPCTIRTNDAVIDSKTVNCDLTIEATGVLIANSRINGFVSTAEGSSYSFTLVDSTVDASPGKPRLATGLGADNFVVIRSEIIGGNRGIYCRRNCHVRDSWIHGTKVAADWQASAIRASQRSTIRHNTLACDWPAPTDQNGGCSANLIMHGDFEPVRDVLIEHNLFVANVNGSAFCASGGSSPSKPHSDAAERIVFRNNVFQRGPNGHCAAFGPVDAYDSTRPGNHWINNVWDEGSPVNP